MHYINAYDILFLAPKTTRSNIPDKFFGVDWVREYANFLSRTKYNLMPCITVMKTDNSNRGNTFVVSELAAMYLEWLCGAKGWELKNRIKHHIYPTQSLYLIQCQKFQKIGMSENFQSRISSIRNATPYEVDVITVADVKDARIHEKNLHEKYKHKRINREWFDLSFEDIQDVIKYIKSVESFSENLSQSVDGIKKTSKKRKLSKNTEVKSSTQLSLFS